MQNENILWNQCRVYFMIANEKVNFTEFAVMMLKFPWNQLIELPYIDFTRNFSRELIFAFSSRHDTESFKKVHLIIVSFYFYEYRKSAWTKSKVQSSLGEAPCINILKSACESQSTECVEYLLDEIMKVSSISKKNIQPNRYKKLNLFV